MDRGWLGFEHVGNGFWYNVTPNLTGARRRRPRRARRGGRRSGRCGGARGSTCCWRPTSSCTSSTSAPGRSSPTATCCRSCRSSSCSPCASAWRRSTRVAADPPLGGARGRRRARGGLRAAAGVLDRVRPRPERQGHPRGRARVDPAARPGRLADRGGELRSAAGARGPARRTTARRASIRSRTACVRLKLPRRARPSLSRDLASACADRGSSTSSSAARVRDRVRAAAEVYPTIVEFYEQLEAEAAARQGVPARTGRARAGAAPLPPDGAGLTAPALTSGRSSASPAYGRASSSTSSSCASPAASSTSPSATRLRPGRTIA